jgi:hypothetical protein
MDDDDAEVVVDFKVVVEVVVVVDRLDLRLNGV